MITDSQAALAGVQIGAWVVRIGPVDAHTPLTTVKTPEEIEAAFATINSLGVEKLALITKRVRRWCLFYPFSRRIMHPLTWLLPVIFTSMESV